MSNENLIERLARAPGRQIVAIALTKMDHETFAETLKELKRLARPADYEEVMRRAMDRLSRGETISQDGDKICPPPAHLLVSTAKFFLSKAAYQRYIYPQVEDIRFEYYEALQAGELNKARWIVIRGYWQALRPLAVAVWGTIAVLLKMST